MRHTRLNETTAVRRCGVPASRRTSPRYSWRRLPRSRCTKRQQPDSGAGGRAPRIRLTARAPLRCRPRRILLGGLHERDTACPVRCTHGRSPGLGGSVRRLKADARSLLCHLPVHRHGSANRARRRPLPVLGEAKLARRIRCRRLGRVAPDRSAALDAPRLRPDPDHRAGRPDAFVGRHGDARTRPRLAPRLGCGRNLR